MNAKEHREAMVKYLRLSKPFIDERIRLANLSTSPTGMSPENQILDDLLVDYLQHLQRQCFGKVLKIKLEYK